MKTTTSQTQKDISTLKTRRAAAPQWAHEMLDRWIADLETELEGSK